MKYYIIAGEASGDLHASNLIKALKQCDQAATFRVWGGDLMAEQGATVVKHYRDLAFMGFAEVLMNLRTIIANMRFCKRDLLEYQPDAVILVDYPGFNLPIARFAHSHQLKVFYYISPQVWAWKKNRVKTIRKVVDKMMVILPFEKTFYQKFGVEVDFVGHPLLDAVDAVPQVVDFREKNQLDERPIIALLPGSRKQEVTRMLAEMLKVIPYFPDYQFVVGGAPSLEHQLYRGIIQDADVKVVHNQTYALLQHAHAALVTSGTATLETALFNVPEVVCYKGNVVSYAIARRIVNIPFISLVNLIMDREVVKELIQNDLNKDNLVQALQHILSETGRSNMRSHYAELRQRLGGSGASQRTAKSIWGALTANA